jgi:hypothetical protein
MIISVAWRTPHTDNTKLTTAAILIIEWTIHATPSMGRSGLYTPAMYFGIYQGRLNSLIGMTSPAHM